MQRKKKFVYLTTIILVVLMILGACLWHSQKPKKETKPEPPFEEPKEEAKQEVPVEEQNVILKMDLPMVSKEWTVSDGIFGEEKKLSPESQFMEDTFNHEINTFTKEAKVAEKIPFLKAFEKSNSGEKTIPVIKTHHDSVYATFEQIKLGRKVAVVNAADGDLIGGYFALPRNNRRDIATQEEALMSIFFELYISLASHGEFENKELVRNRSHWYIPTYKKIGKGVFLENMFYTGLLGPRIPMTYFDNYNEDKGEKIPKGKFFNNYVISEHKKRKINFNSDREKSKLVGVYSFAAPDNSNNDFETLYALKEVKNTIRDGYSAMFQDAKARGFKYFVLTLTGVGAFSGGSKEFVKTIEESVIEAIRTFGYGFEEIIICGFTGGKDPSAELMNTMKEAVK
jgi:hypothetical protein